MDRRDAWTKLKKFGYEGPRGQHFPENMPVLFIPERLDSRPSPPYLKPVTPRTIPARKGRRWRR
jgi:hypothetical protein